MNTGEVYYVGLDVHKKNVAYCVKRLSGEVVARGQAPSRREDLRRWAESMGNPWIGAIEATMFTGWIYDTLKPYALELKVANPFKLDAIAKAKKKEDRLDAAMLSDLLRVNLLPECHMASSEVRDLRRLLRFRNLLVRLATTLKNRTSGLLMECGQEYNKEKLHGKRYFKDLLGTLSETPDSVRQMLSFNHKTIQTFARVQRQLVTQLRKNALLSQRVARLQSIAGVGPILALTWALEIDDPKRFSSNRHAVSYCGLCSRLDSSAGKNKRGPLCKQRNKHLQWALIEVAKLAPRYNEQLKAIHANEVERGNRNRATLAVARKLVAYLMAVDKSGQPFVARELQAA
jgi:transposase